MTAITLSNIPRESQVAIRRKAQTEGLSLNKAVQALLAEAVGLRHSETKVLFDDLDHLAGSWSEEEADELDASLADQRQIDPELWE